MEDVDLWSLPESYKCYNFFGTCNLSIEKVTGLRKNKRAVTFSSPTFFTNFTMFTIVRVLEMISDDLNSILTGLASRHTFDLQN